MNNFFNIVDIKIPNSLHIHRQYCTTFNNVHLLHSDPVIEKGVAYEYVTIFQNGKKIKAGLNKDVQKIGDKSQIYYEKDYDVFNLNDSVVLNNTYFLLYDETGQNYIHFFFDFFQRLFYFDELRKINSNLILAIPEDFYKNSGNSNFIKQWIELYYGNNMPNIEILKKGISYNIKEIILSNVFYWFPEPHGDDYIISKIIETASKIPAINVSKKGCYISRQDTIKRGWYHNRILENETELIEKIKRELDYDIIELMDYDMIGKIQIFKSYQNIIQQSSASNLNILFSNQKNTNIIICHPVMQNWLNHKCSKFAQKSKTNLITLEGGGELTAEFNSQTNSDYNNLAWKIENLDGLIDVLKTI
jgi:hypothetical protein